MLTAANRTELQPSPSPPVPLYKAGPTVVKVGVTRIPLTDPRKPPAFFIRYISANSSTYTPWQVLTAVFKFLKINDVDVASCANDAGNAGVYLKDFAQGNSAQMHSISAPETAIASFENERNIKICICLPLQA